LLLPAYKTVKELKSVDWRSSSSRKGIIDRCGNLRLNNIIYIITCIISACLCC
jgi:hypothetical protein